MKAYEINNTDGNSNSNNNNSNDHGDTAQVGQGQNVASMSAEGINRIIIIIYHPQIVMDLI